MSYSNLNLKEMVVKDHNSLIFVDKYEGVGQNANNSSSSISNNQPLRCTSNHYVNNMITTFGKNQELLNLRNNIEDQENSHGKAGERFHSHGRSLVTSKEQMTSSVCLKSPHPNGHLFNQKHSSVDMSNQLESHSVAQFKPYQTYMGKNIASEI